MTRRSSIRRLAQPAILLCLVAMTVFLGRGLAGGVQDPKPDASENRPEDRAAIAAAMQSFVKAFESADAKALADHWTEEGEYLHDDGVTIRGRADLAKQFGEHFKKVSKAKAEVEPGSLRFVARDVAIADGVVSVKPDPSEPTASAHYEAVVVREDGRWRFASLIETPTDEASLRDLAWLVGDWKSIEQGVEIHSNYSWGDNKKFINVRFSMKENDRALAGTQVLAKDPATGEIRSWTFEAEGGIGEGTWSRDGDHWVIEAMGTHADGRVLTATNILRRINNDLFTWQSINRSIDDEELPDLPPTKVVRTPAK